MQRGSLWWGALACAVLSGGCDDGETDGGGGVAASDCNLQLAHPAGVVFDPAAEVTVTVYGYSVLVADASASVITTQTYSVAALPFSTSLSMPDNPHELIDQGHGPVAAEDAGFYLNLYLDVDGDGQICPGDYIRDYDRSDQEFYPGALPSQLEIYLVETDSGYTCRPVPTG